MLRLIKIFFIIVISIFALFFIITFSIFLINPDILYNHNEFIKQNLQNNNDSLLKTNEDLHKIPINKSDYIQGPPTAKITIVEFADFACPYCRKSFPKIRELSIKYKNDIRIVFKDLPIISEFSMNLAMAGRCAGEQGKFWEMHDKLFLNQGLKSENELLILAKQLNLDTRKFNSCLNTKKYQKDIDQDIIDAKELNLSGTPIFFVNSKKITGDISRISDNDWQKLIELANKK